MKKRVLLSLLCLAPLLMATKCDDDDKPSMSIHNYKVVIKPESSVELNDTVWVEGRVSSKAYSLTLRDSVFNTTSMTDFISVFKFVTPDLVADINTEGALNSFELIKDKGNIHIGAVCTNAELLIEGVLSPDESAYVYRLGFKALQKGDYLFRWDNRNQIVNIDRHIGILSGYSLKTPNQIGFNRCGSFSWTINGRDLDQEYLFNVR